MAYKYWCRVMNRQADKTINNASNETSELKSLFTLMGVHIAIFWPKEIFQETSDLLARFNLISP
jgi:hypothetical protein